MLAGKHIVLGVSGGIAAYKSALLVREFIKQGAEVQVVMTASAAQFVTPLTFGTLSRREVITEMFSEQPATHWTRHIDLGLWADVMLVAPATANTLAKIAHGMADNFLTSLVLALRCPLVVAPSMDADMYMHAATQHNLSVLRQRGCHIIEPETGDLASGLTGPGRLPEPAVMMAFIEQLLVSAVQDFQGRTILVTAGPTYEPLDPVRFLGNRSSGKMGFAVAAAAARRGADVTLIAGPVALDTPSRVRRIDVETGRQMYEAVLAEFDRADALIMAAAVADFTPASPSRSKLKRGELEDRFILECEKNPDILRAAGARKKHQVLVGFALETEDEVEHARAKLSAKRLDMIVANNPLVEGAAFGSDTNVVTILYADGRIDRLPLTSKGEIAHGILNRVHPLLRS